MIKDEIKTGDRKNIEDEIKIEELSSKYTVKKLGTHNVADIFDLCHKNKLYYKYCPPSATEESIRRDMQALPPNVNMDDKFYIGYYKDGILTAVMDLIRGYPQKDIAYIGFFMTNTTIQKKGIGTEIISELCNYLKQAGFAAIQLSWVKGNPQSEHFWKKNKFIALKETTSHRLDPVILAERIL